MISRSNEVNDKEMSLCLTKYHVIKLNPLLN